MRFLGDIATLSWKRDTEDLCNFSMPLEIGFRDNDALPVTFTNLTFKYELLKNKNVISTYSSDPMYLTTDQEYIYSTMITDLSPNIKYTLKIWTSNAGSSFEMTDGNIVLPLPISPYPSWVWNANTNEWEAPVPLPSDPPPNKWVWDEDIKQWVVKQI